MINEVTNKLLTGVKVVDVEFKEVFEEIFSGLANDIQTTSFLTALKKTDFDDNLFSCAIEASTQSIKKPFSLKTENLIENISLKSISGFIDIPLLQDLICSSADLNVSKYSFDSFLDNNSFDILKNMGVNLEKNIDFSSVEFEKLNFSYFYLPKDAPYFKYSEQIRLSLPFDNIFNFTKNMLNPLGAKNLFLGVLQKELVEKFAGICLNLQKENSIVVCGQDMLPFVSLSGESYVAEAWKNKIFTYELTPEHLGFKFGDLAEIKCENNEQNANDILEIIFNKKKDAKYDIAIINSALSLYISKKADSIIDGINLAKKLLDDGVVAQKFKQIVKFYS